MFGVMIPGIVDNGNFAQISFRFFLLIVAISCGSWKTPAILN